MSELADTLKEDRNGLTVASSFLRCTAGMASRSLETAEVGSQELKLLLVVAGIDEATS